MKKVILLLCVSLIGMEAVFFVIGAGKGQMGVLAILGVLTIGLVAIFSHKNASDQS